MLSTAATLSWPMSSNPYASRALLASWMGWMFDGYEGHALVLVMMPAVQQVLTPDRLASTHLYASGLLAATMLGWAIGGVAAGVMADYLGRRRTLMLSILCYAVFAGLTTLAWGYWSLLICRFFTGIGLGAEWVLLLLLMAISSVVAFWSASTWVPEYAAHLATDAKGQFHLSSAGAALSFSVVGLIIAPFAGPETKAMPLPT